MPRPSGAVLPPGAGLLTMVQFFIMILLHAWLGSASPNCTRFALAGSPPLLVNEQLSMSKPLTCCTLRFENVALGNALLVRVQSVFEPFKVRPLLQSANAHLSKVMRFESLTRAP